MKRILVTGGAGFIGSHLVRELLKRGHEVLCVDNLFTGSKENLRELMGERNFEFIRHDIIEPLTVEVDEIYNLACPASPIHYQYNPIKTIKCSTLGMINMLGLAKRVKARILQASTSEVYGDPEVHPQKESYWGNVNPIGIRSCYDEGKRVAECLCMDYHRMNGVDVKIVRIFNTYGPQMAQNDGRVVSNFLVQALKNEPITIYGDGTQTRSFMYVSDLVEGLIAMMECPAFIGPVNLGNPEEYTIKDIAEQVSIICRSGSRIIHEPLPQDDPRRRKPDISLAREKLGWSPRVTLNEGLGYTKEYFAARLNLQRQ
ncbi:MAG: SDR family oxidoreductase [Candidatus Eremiobacteraeota bacterium]|nr:SDR family oxidoreductase [Candidatus Eremiobacteraeota bacterium]